MITMATDVECQLNNIKKSLKVWEGSFVKENDRKPNKDDISQAPADIQESYKEYSSLKRQQQQKSGDVNHGAWGSELNKKHEKVVADVSNKKSDGCKTSLMGKLGQKLFENTSNTPPKQKKKPCWGLSRSFSQQNNSAPKTNCFSQGKSKRKDSDCKSVWTSAKPPEVVSDEGESEPKSSFLSVLEKVTHKTLSKETAQNNAVFSFGCSPSITKGKNLAEKYKFVDKFQPDIAKPESDTQHPAESLGYDSGPETNHVEPSYSRSVKPKNHTQNTDISQDAATVGADFQDVDFDDSFTFDEGNEAVSTTGRDVNPSNTTGQGKKRKASGDLESEVENRSTKSRRTSSTTRGHCGRATGGGSGGSSGKRATNRAKEQPDEDWENAGASEVAWQPDKLNVNIETNIEDQDQDDEEDDVKPQKKSTKSRSSGPCKSVSNDNFVRLNMKLKTYKRKGRHMTGGQYKRQQWKQKMKGRSDSYGDKCFKCGESGHWAKDCKGKGKPKVPGMAMGDVADNVVQDADFPTLREAMGMSQGIRSAENKPEKTTVKRQTQPDKASRRAEDTSEQGNKSTPAEEDVADLDHEDDLDLERAIYRPGYEAPEPPPPVEPLYELQEDGSLPEPTAEVMAALHMFGFKSFRKGQQEAVMRILCGLSTLVVLSTGSGKSLCYQLAAYLYATKTNSITLVISPLVSLMEDQVTGLPPGVKGACLHTNMTPVQRKRVVEAVTEGSIHFLLVSPEAMTSSGASSLMASAQLPPIAFVCIDEAHCVSEWSHHFRPSYLRICKVLRENYGVRCMLGLTATATMVTAASVAQHLGIHDYRTSTIRDIPVPTNLLLSASRDEDKDQSLLALLQGDRFASCGSVIIYCTRREQTTRIATLIRTCMKDIKTPLELLPIAEEQPKKGKGKKSQKKPVDPSAWTSECYHAGMSAAQRKRVQTAFMTGRLRVVVATVAFGMGVDKSDVRGIIHYSMPKSFESYVQEIGRAGRDGNPSHCHVFLDHLGRDSSELKRHIYANTIDRIVIKKLVKRFFPPCRCKEKQKQPNTREPRVPEERVCPGHERAIPTERTVQEFDIKEEGVSTLLCYLELHPRQWLVNLQSVYATCTIQCYGGPRQLQHLAKKCPPVAVAVARQQKKGASFAKSNSLEFPVVEVSDSMGWESGPVKRELKLLQWNTQGGNIPRKSGVMVSFTDLAFHIRSPGDLDDDETDDVVSFLHDRIQTQEKTELYQLQRLQDTLRSVSHKDVWMCADQLDTVRSDKLKEALRQYFDEQPELKDGQVTMLSFSREYGSQDQGSILEQVHCDHEDQVKSDMRQFIHLYGSEHSLTGRAIARIFHGIPSPCFRAEVWGRVRRFWRCHLDIDFNLLRRLATQQLINLR